MSDKPKSATGVWSGLSGLIVGSVVAYVATYWDLGSYLKTIVVALAAAATMITVDMLVYRVHRNASTGLAPRPVNPWNVGRIAQKTLAFYGIIVAMLAIYFWLIPEYASDFYTPFKQAAMLCTPFIVLVAPLYIAFVDRRQLEPNDNYVSLFRLVLGNRPDDWTPLSQFATGWLVKLFFLPIMFVFLTGNMEQVSVSGLADGFHSFSNFYDLAYDLFYMWDVIPALLGYVLTLRYIDSHIRSVDSTMLGWVVCLSCYPPFWSGVTFTYLQYDQDDLYWADFVSHSPIVYVIWGSVILALLIVYVWATAMFGTRFSNLTHRGIITNGPYRWVKHPAYLSKNITWWLISVPFLTSGDILLAAQSCALLAGVSFIYFMRGLTEERHLALDPIYREYQAFIAEHGLWAVLRRLTRRFGNRPAKTGETAAPLKSVSSLPPRYPSVT